MFLQTILTTTTLLLASAHAQSKPAAIVVIEASHGGAGQDLTNITVTIPLTATYSNASALAEVSTLYLIDAVGVPVTSISCTPFKRPNGTGKSGLTFDSTTPSYLSTNTVQVGSIVCISTDISLAPPGGSSSAAAASSSIVSTGMKTSTPLLETTTKTHKSVTHASTTSTVQQTQTQATATTASSSSTSPTVPASTGNGARSLSLSGELFGGLALAGFGLAFAL